MHNSIKIFSIGPKYELDLDFHLMYLYTKFHFNMWIHSRDIERKHWNFDIFLSPRGITLSIFFDRTQKCTWPKFSSDVSVYKISFQNVNPFQRYWTETLKFSYFSKWKGHNSVKKFSIGPKYELDLDFIKCVCIQNFISICESVLEILNGNSEIWIFFKMQGT